MPGCPGRLTADKEGEMMESGKQSSRVALCGILTALAVAWMLAAGFFGVLTYAAPMVAGGLLIVPVKEYGSGTALTMFAAVSLLSLILVTDKELALFYVLLFGYYPILQPLINRLSRRPIRMLLKGLVFNAGGLLAMGLAAYVFRIPLWDGARPAWPLLVGFAAAANVCFALYDRALLQFFTLYDVKICVWLHKLFRF